MRELALYPPNARFGGEEMKYRTYPQTDLRVSEVGFGLWTTGTT